MAGGGFRLGVVVVAFARERDVLGSSGVLLMCWALGSLVAGALAGLVTWRRPPLTRYRIGAVVLAASLLPMPFVGPPVLLGALLAVSGFAVAPTLIAAVSVVQTSVPPPRLTEALGWSSTGISAGVATGAALGGATVDRAGSVAGDPDGRGRGVRAVPPRLLSLRLHEGGECGGRGDARGVHGLDDPGVPRGVHEL